MGITIISNEKSPELNNLKNVIAQVLGTSVGQEPTNMLPEQTPDGKPYDIGFYIGAKTGLGFRKDGSEPIASGAKSVTIAVDAEPPYSVTGRTTWGSSFQITETAKGHFTVTFDRPAPSQQKFNWTIYRYQ